MKPTDKCIVVIGKESTGKSQLIASLTNRPAYASNFRGSTVNCDIYRNGGYAFVDTPGILRQSDTLTTRAALDQLRDNDVVLLIVQATHIDNDLADLLPLVKGKSGLVVVTFWDKVRVNASARQALERISKESGLPFIPVDARRLSQNEYQSIIRTLQTPQHFIRECIRQQVGWNIEPPPTWLERPHVGPILALLLLLLPAVIAVWAANTFAESINAVAQALVTPMAARLDGLSSLPKEILIGNYGFMTMGPLLFVWTVPTVLLYALFLGCYKASGLIDRITSALHPVMRPFGLSGRDLVRVMMGFGCNVPAVISTRACSVCSRRTCVSAIAFGSACSYQFGATLGVFAAIHLPYMVIPYLLYLTLTTLLYTRLSAPREARSRLNVLMVESRTFLVWPRPSEIWRESRGTISQFFRRAIPVFYLITVTASILNWLGVIDQLAGLLSPVLAIFHLPVNTALPVLLASIRKDGILLFVSQDNFAAMTPGQILTGVYLAGVLLPCLVTCLTIMREESVGFIFKLLHRQVIAACCFTLILAWTTALLGW
ncbi:MAG: 50S ribosome-binding GTPase [Acidobacteriota bacterium]|nr:50S ribosome-binding GTPase [Acidobacteriota bacterium]